jgi:hypothetical protein
MALVVGLVLSPFLARLWPFGLDGRMAATIMGADRWNAGAALMAAQSPEAWRDLESAAEPLTPNKAALAVCRDTAAKMKKEQHCTVVPLSFSSTVFAGVRGLGLLRRLRSYSSDRRVHHGYEPLPTSLNNHHKNDY